MTQNIKNFIENGEKEFEEKFGFLNNIIESHCIIGAKEWNWGKEIKRFIYSRQISLIKMIVERDIKYWKNIFDNPPKRDKEYPCDNCTQNICRIEITRLEKELLELTDGK